MGDNFYKNRFPKQPDDKLLPIKQPWADTFFILSLTGTLMRFRVRVIANNKHDFSYAVRGDVRNNCKKRKITIMIIKKMKKILTV